MLKSVYESQDDIPEALREFYPEKDGKFSFVGVEGYKPLSEFTAVQNALTKERGLHKTTKELHQPFIDAFVGTPYEGKSAADIKAELERIPVLEADASGKYDKNKVQELVEAAAKNRLAPVERERDTAKAKILELEGVIKQHQEADRRRTIFDAVRSEAAKDGSFHETTYASNRGALMLLCAQCLTIDEGGNVVVAEDVEGMTSGLSVKDALAELRNQHPYLAKASHGGGANGSNGGSSSGPNPFKQNDLDVRMKYIKANPDTWQKQMANAGLKNATDTYVAPR